MSMLILMDNDLNELTSNDDVSTGRDSRITQFRLPKDGQYVIVATRSGLASGTTTRRVHAGDHGGRDFADRRRVHGDAALVGQRRPQPVRARPERADDLVEQPADSRRRRFADRQQHALRNTERRTGRAWLLAGADHGRLRGVGVVRGWLRARQRYAVHARCEGQRDGDFARRRTRSSSVSAIRWGCG